MIRWFKLLGDLGDHEEWQSDAGYVRLIDPTGWDAFIYERNSDGSKKGVVKIGECYKNRNTAQAAVRRAFDTIRPGRGLRNS